MKSFTEIDEFLLIENEELAPRFLLHLGTKFYFAYRGPD